jgi:glycerophosphoryl diester phosphodiesterase
MDFGTWFGQEFAGASIVPFEEQLRCYRKAAPGVQFYAETKAPAEYGGRMEPRLVELLRRLDLVPKGAANPRTAPVIIQSFERDSLAAVKRLAPSLPTAWLWVVPPADAPTDTSAPAGVDVIAPTASYIVNRPEIVQAVHDSGREVHTWTVDDPAEMDQLLADGVDGIFSNDSATLRARVDAHTGRAARKAVTLEPGCPGIAGTVTASSGGAGPDAAASTSTRLAAPSPTVPDDDSSSWAPVAVVIVVLLALGGLGTWWFMRRRA